MLWSKYTGHSFLQICGKISIKNTLAVKKVLKRLGVKRCEIKMGGQGQWSVTADGNKILIITIQAAKH